jgi:hypothetical protein
MKFNEVEIQHPRSSLIKDGSCTLVWSGEIFLEDDNIIALNIVR